MAFDKNKIIAEATKLVQKGALDKAIKTYEKVLAEDPKDVRVLLKIGELHQKKGDERAAADAFKKVADTYSEQGFFLKAVAVYKQIVKLDPEEVRVNERLAGLYQQLGLMSDAMSQYQLMAAAYERAGDAGRLVDVLKQMVELDPENIASSIKLGELYARSNDAGPALQHLRRAADHLKKQNRAEEYLKVAERISQLQGDDSGLARELANIYLAKGDTKRALAKLQLCFKADPKDVETLTLLAQAFRDLGQTSKTASVYKELARLHEERGHGGEARATWRKVLELVPDDPDACDALGSAAAPQPVPGRASGPAIAFGGSAPARAAPPPGPPPGARAPAPFVIAPPPPAGVARPGSAPATGADAIPKLLTEADVYVKYGLHEKAVDHLKRVLAIDAGHPDALDRLRDLHHLSGRGVEAADAGARAVRACLARGLVDRARDAGARLRQIAPAHPVLAELGRETGAGADSGNEDEPVLEGEALVPDEPFVSTSSADDDAIALAAAADHGGEEIVEEEEPVAVDREDADADPDEGVALEVEAEPDPEPLAPDLGDELEEAEFFVQQGLLDEAREALQALLDAHPGHPQVVARFDALRLREAPAAPPAATSDAFDLGRELEELSGAMPLSSAADDFQYSVEDVFNQFKKGVEQTVRPEDSDTHYDLGIAYKEMGLLDDAIHEFEVALQGGNRRKEIDCLSMIGLCNLAKGDPKAAVVAFQRGLRAQGLTREAAKALQYELGSAYEGAGDPQAALFFLQRVRKADPAYRDVAARVQALGDGPGRPPPEAAAPPVRPAHGSSDGARSNGTLPPRPPALPRAPAPSTAPAAGKPASPGAPPLPGKKNIGYL
jgi:tetratricopeptide (TPR) repeat protein